MKQPHRAVMLAALALAAALPAGAQETPRRDSLLVFSGQVRVRNEYDDRGIAADPAVGLHLLRTRLRATARPLGGLTLVAEVQDARHVEGGAPPPAGTPGVPVDGFELHQAWVGLRRPLGLPVELRGGRQEISFANERLIGASPWSNTGRVFDGGRATLRPGRQVSVDLFGARQSTPTPAPTGPEDLYGAWATWRPSPAVTADAFALRDENTNRIRRGDDEGEAVLRRNTLGANLRGKLGWLEAELEGARQTGRRAASDSTARREVHAFFGSASLAALLLPGRQAKLHLQAAVLSGDRSAQDGRDERFSTLFGTNHRFYGTMDYVPELAGDHGLVDLGTALSAVPARNLRVLLEGHLFRPHRRSDERFGSEADLTAMWRIVRPLEISGGASVFFPGPLLRERVGDSPRVWAYVAGVWDF